MQMKFKAHQSFFIRKGWLGKGLRAVSKDDSILMPSRSKDAMDELGLGSNQVVALRYWLQVTGLVEYADGRRRALKVTNLGELIRKQDPYIEEIGTLWALHCNLASEKENAAAWYFLFNEFGQAIFDKESFVDALSRYVFNFNDKRDVARSSLEADFNCVLNTYIPHGRTSSKPVSPENVIDCPLGELGLVDVENKREKTYRKKPANQRTLPDLLVLYAIYSMRQKAADESSGLPSEIRLETLLSGPCSPGSLYNLDSIGLLAKLYELEANNLIRINRTAGLDVIRLEEPGRDSVWCLERYYEMLG